MKKIITILISAIMLFTACGSSAKQIAPEEEFNGVMFGMTKGEVIQAKGRQPDSTDHGLDYYNEIFCNISNASIFFGLNDEGYLSSIVIRFYYPDDESKNISPDYVSLKQDLLIRYPSDNVTEENDQIKIKTENRRITLSKSDNSVMIWIYEYDEAEAKQILSTTTVS